MENTISVVVPVYNVEKYLRKCLDSIVDQTYRDLEILLVDDGSTDSSPIICEEYARMDERVKVIHQKNQGVWCARRNGTNLATGKYIGYVDGDDWIESDMFCMLIKWIEQYDVDVVETGCIDSWEGSEKKRITYLPEGCYKGDVFEEKIAPFLLYCGSFFEHGVSAYLVTKLFRRDVMCQIQSSLPETLKLHDDTMCSFPYIAKTKSIYISNYCFYHYRVRSDSLKRSKNAVNNNDINSMYAQMCTAFDGTTKSAKYERQVQYYLMYYLLFKNIEIFDNQDAHYFLAPYGDIDKEKKLVLYGAGAFGVQLYKYVENVYGKDHVHWVDQNYAFINSEEVENPNILNKITYDYVVVSIIREEAYRSARRDLINFGIPKEKIVWINERYLRNPGILLDKAGLTI